MNAKELKPCPFCGSNDSWTDSALGKRQVLCNSCEASGPTEETDDEAIDSWNRLAALRSDAAQAPRVASADLDELRRATCAIKIVGQIDGHDVIRRGSAVDIIEQRERRAAPVAPAAAARDDDARLGAFVRKLAAQLDDSPKSFLANVQRAIDDLADVTPAPAQPDERAAFEAKFPVPSGVKWDGTKYLVLGARENSYRIERFGGQWEGRQARAAAAPLTDGLAPAKSHCQNGGDVCLAWKRDGICCPEDSCDIDDGTRKDPTSVPQPDARAVFEAWAKLRCYDLTRCSPEAYAAYKSDLTEGAWSGWLAASQLSTETVDKPVQRMSAAEHDVLAERARQVTVEGWTPNHDDHHDEGQLAAVAGYYALACSFPHSRDLGLGQIPAYWPWDKSWWKPTTARRNLVKAGALIIAEIERLDRVGIEDEQDGAQPSEVETEMRTFARTKGTA